MIKAPSLRLRLRNDTRLSHERVEAIFQHYDITHVDGLGHFLTTHLRVFSRLHFDDGPERPGAEALQTRYCDAIKADLKTLGLSTPPQDPTVGVLPISAQYIFLGSRLGAQVIWRDWSVRAVGKVRQAEAYLSIDAGRGEWQQHCQQLSSHSPDGSFADRVVGDANRIFDLFLAYSPDAAHV